MSLAGYLTGVAGSQAPLGLGFSLVGTLHPAVSSPLLVWLGLAMSPWPPCSTSSYRSRTDRALLLLLPYTSRLDVPAAALTLELAVTVIVPTVVGVAVRTAEGSVPAAATRSE